MSTTVETEYRFKDFYIPASMMGAIRRYVEHGIPPGDFLQAVISNDLREAIGCADDENIHNLSAYVIYLYNEVPSACWGSMENMLTWIVKFKEVA